MDDPKSIRQSTLITQLQDVESPKRLLAILNAKTIQEPNPSLTRAIELLALSDPDKSVQQAAIDLLAEPQFQSAQRSLTSLPVAVREKLFTELVRWERDGLIFTGQANILKGRMATEPIQWKQPTPIKQPEANVAATAFDPPNPQVTALTASNQAVPGDTRQERSEFSLSKLLLSETSIRIALFLGAFFVLASAIILMALVEVARLPILGVTTLGFYAGAASLKRRLPLASFVLFLVGTFLLPIDMAVIGSLVRLSDSWLVWSITAGLVGTLFLFGIFWYDSKLLPILAYLAYALALAIPALAAEFDLEWAFFLQVLLGMAGAMFSYLIYRWKSLGIFLPFFQFIQVLLLLEVMADVLLLLLVFIIPYRETDLRLPAAACFAFQGLAFSICDWINARVQSKPQIYLAFSMACFTVFPSVLALRFIPDRILWLTLVCAFGAVLTVLGELFDEKSPDHLSFLARPFFGAGFLLFVISTIWQSTQDARFATGFLAGIAALYLAIGIRRRQWLLSSLGLLSAYLGYLQVFQIPALQERGIFLGAIHLPPAIILLSIGLFFFWRKGSRKWWIVPVQLGFISGLITVFYTLINGVDMPNTAGVIFLIITIYLALISVVFRWTYLTAGATFCLAISVLFFVRPWENPAWLLPLTSLGLLYYLCGAGLNRRSLTRPWSAILRISGLFLIAALALIQFAVFQPGAYLLYLLLTAIVGWEAYTHRLQQALLPALFLLAIAFGFLLFEKNIALENWGIYFTGQAALYFLAGWLLPAAYKPLKSWAVSLRLAGLALLGLVLVLNQGFPSLTTAGLSGTCLAAFLVVESILRRQILALIAALSVVALTLFDLLIEYRIKPIQPYFIGLGLSYIALGWGLSRRSQSKPWGEALRVTGLIFGGLSGLASRDIHLASMVLLVALVGAAYGLEAIRWRNVWLSYPAAGLFYISYLIALGITHTTQPQFYSFGAAILGVALHYFMLRNGYRKAAVLTGLSAQLILLSTTYTQLIDSGRIGFFYLEFFQSLALLVYGLLVRSRSFVGIPIFFALLTVVTVMFSLLKGLPTAILIGSTGIGLLILGTISLLMRERLMLAADRFGQHLSNW